MNLNTKHFGEITIEDDKILDVIGGIPGFDGDKYVILRNNEDDTDPFMWLQSVTDGDVALVLVNAFIFFPTYTPEIKDEYVENLEHESQEDLAVYNVVVIPDDIKKMTVNLKAPILINGKKKKAMQVIVENEEYDIRHNLYEQVEELNKKIKASEGN